MKTPPRNGFYGAVDGEAFEPHRPGDYRTPFQVERDRLIHSPWFRKLQSKTQVFLSGEYDFYRTRLTHSIEVAQIGRSLCQYLRLTTDALGEDAWIDPDLVEAICLAHDLGHPPFGHAGERALHELMRPYGGFEGNPQTLRLLTRTFYEREEGYRGMNPTRALMDGIMKYKRLWKESGDAHHHFLYDEQEADRTFVMGSVKVPAGAAGEGWNRMKSIECRIMDWADDTAYCLNDLIDGRKAGFITWENLERWAGRQTFSSSAKEVFEKLVSKIRHGSLDSYFGWRIGEFIKACRLVPVAQPVVPGTQRYAWELAIEPEVREEADLYKRIAVDLIFRSPQLQQIEFKGTLMLQRLFAALMEHYGTPGTTRPLAFLPPATGERLRQAGDEQARARIIADILSGLTDSAAIRMYKRLFDPDFASISDLAD